MTGNPPVVSLRRRLGALLYDVIAVIAVLYFASFVPVIAAGGTALEPGNPLFRCYLLIVMFLYFGVSWTRGRTLGMQAWKLDIETLDGARPGWKAAAVRFAAAAASLALGGLGYLVALGNRERVTWPDRWSRTRLVHQREHERART